PAARPLQRQRPAPPSATLSPPAPGKQTASRPQPAMDGSPTKADDGVGDRRSSGYRSWKKKYRKMRIVFDHKMHHGEELHKKEDKALATVNRLAVENDRLLDLLVELNNSPQMPPEKRIDVSLEPPADPRATALPMDRQRALRKDHAMKRLEQLLADVPHMSYRACRDSQHAAYAAYAADLAPPDGEAYATAFLSADDVDNYIYDIDTRLDPDAHIPTLAPRARPGAHPVPHAHLKNPTSVTNWLRKHAPKIFLQDGETHGDAGDDADGHGHGHGAGGHGHAGGRKSRGGRGERGGRGSTRG
ncbi:Uncharacterized protein TCAP_02432, partial [Tolypocladium capitatum]